MVGASSYWALSSFPARGLRPGPLSARLSRDRAALGVPLSTYGTTPYCTRRRPHGGRYPSDQRSVSDAESAGLEERGCNGFAGTHRQRSQSTRRCGATDNVCDRCRRICCGYGDWARFRYHAVAGGHCSGEDRAYRLPYNQSWRGSDRRRAESVPDAEGSRSHKGRRGRTGQPERSVDLLPPGVAGRHGAAGQTDLPHHTERRERAFGGSLRCHDCTASRVDHVFVSPG